MTSPSKIDNKPVWAMSTNAKFMVHLSNFAVTGMADTDAGTRPSLLEINFGDYQRFVTEQAPATDDPVYPFDKSFEYTTRLINKLSSKYLKVKCISVGTESLIGEASVDIRTIMTGPIEYELTLIKDDQPAGVLTFSCVAFLTSDISIHLSNLSIICTNNEDKDLLLKCSTSLDPKFELIIMPNQAVTKQNDVYEVETQGSLWDLIGPDNKCAVLMEIYSGVGSLIGTVHIIYREFFSFSEPQQFNVPIKDSDSLVVGSVTGTIHFSDYPRMAQMSGGKCYSNGAVVGGFLLYPGLEYPASFGADVPPHLLVKDERVDEAQNLGKYAQIPEKAPTLNTTSALYGGNEYLEILKKVPLPPHWSLRHDVITGRPYFADDRVKETCWEDPRFLPQGFDQRIDPKAKKTYFAFHETKQTTFVDPRPALDGWQMKLDTKGQAYWIYVGTQKTTYQDPRGLPKGFGAAIDYNGRLYFVNHQTKETQWDDPRAHATKGELRQWKADELREWIIKQVQEYIENAKNKN